jgi:hypothetical protein
MDGLNSDAQQVAILLHHTYTNTNEGERRKAEAQLAMLNKDSNKFLELMLSIITHPSIDAEFNKIKDSAATYIAASIKTQIQTEVYSQQHKNIQLTAIFESMMNENVGQTLKIHLAACMTSLLSMDMSDDMRGLIFPVLLKAISTGKKHPALAGLIGLQSLVASISVGVYLAKTFQESVKTLTLWASAVVTQILTDIGKFVLQKPSEQEPEIHQRLMENMSLLKTWAETIKSFITKFQEKKGNLLQNVTIQEALVQNFVQILCIQLPIAKQINECIVSTSGLIEFDNICNDIKTMVMKCLNIVIAFMFETRPDLNIQNSKFYTFLLTGLPLVISTLIKFCKEDTIDLDAAISNEAVEGFIVECLIFLTHIAPQTEFFNLFAETKKPLFMDVILPLLKTSKSEMELFKQAPEEFVHLALDTCDRQLSETFKTAAAQLMEILCDHIDGSLTFIAVIALQLINYSLVSDNPQEIPNKFQVLAEFANSNFLTKTPANIRTETCLIVISVLSYLIPRRNDLMTLLEQTLMTYHEYFLNHKSDPLIRSRICLVIAYYAENIFQDNIKYKDMYAHHLTFLVESVGNRNPGEQACALQAIDSLSTIFDDEDLVPRMTPFINDILLKFAEYTTFISQDSFYEIIQEIVKAYALKISEKPDLIVGLISMLVLKVQNELKALASSGQNNNLVINKCWNIIRVVAEQRYYTKYQPQIEAALGPLLLYMEDPTKIDFDDDIMLLVSTFIKKTGKISETCWTLFGTFPKFFQKYLGMFGNLFPALNNYIIYGKDVLIQQPQLVDLILNMGIESLFTKAKSANEANHAEGAVLFQLLITYLNQNLGLERWEKMFVACLERLSREVKRPFLRARIHGVFLLAFFQNYTAAQELLMVRKKLGFVLTDILEHLADFGHLYDRKVFILGLSTILTQAQLAPEVSEKFTQIFDSLITMLKFIQYLETSHAKKRKFSAESDESDNEAPNDNDSLKKFLNNSNTLSKNQLTHQDMQQEEDQKMEESSDEDEDDDFNLFSENDEVEARLTLETLKSAIKEEDEFAYFKNIIFQIKEKNPQALKQFISQLPDAKQNYLTHVMQSVRITVNPEENRKATRRVVTVKARKAAGSKTLGGGDMKE